MTTDLDRALGALARAETGLFRGTLDPQKVTKCVEEHILEDHVSNGYLRDIKKFPFASSGTRVGTERETFRESELYLPFNDDGYTPVEIDTPPIKTVVSGITAKSATFRTFFDDLGPAGRIEWGPSQVNDVVRMFGEINPEHLSAIFRVQPGLVAEIVFTKGNDPGRLNIGFFPIWYDMLCGGEKSPLMVFGAEA